MTRTTAKRPMSALTGRASERTLLGKDMYGVTEHRRRRRYRLPLPKFMVADSIDICVYFYCHLPAYALSKKIICWNRYGCDGEFFSICMGDELKNAAL